MSKLSEWAGRMKPTQLLYEIETNGDTTGLYMMKERIGNGVPCYEYMSPIYYVWICDKMVLTTMDYRTACDTYKKRLEESI